MAMFYVYLEAGRERELLTTALDFLSAQFFGAKFSEYLPGPVAVYGAATGRPRQALMIFERGSPRRDPLAAAPPAAEVTGINSRAQIG